MHRTYRHKNHHASVESVQSRKLQLCCQLNISLDVFLVLFGTWRSVKSSNQHMAMGCYGQVPLRSCLLRPALVPMPPPKFTTRDPLSFALRWSLRSDKFLRNRKMHRVQKAEKQHKTSWNHTLGRDDISYTVNRTYGKQFCKQFCQQKRRGFFAQFIQHLPHLLAHHVRAHDGGCPKKRTWKKQLPQVFHKYTGNI